MGWFVGMVVDGVSLLGPQDIAGHPLTMPEGTYIVLKRTRKKTAYIGHRPLTIPERTLKKGIVPRHYVKTHKAHIQTNKDILRNI